MLSRLRSAPGQQGNVAVVAVGVNEGYVALRQRGAGDFEVIRKP
jgi:hypothetical protein